MHLSAYLLQARGQSTCIIFKCIRKKFQKFGKTRETTVGWFYGYKLHLIIMCLGEIFFQPTSGNVADVSAAESLSKGVFGKMFGYKRYISTAMSKPLLEKGLELFIKVKSYMK